jgi:hypothetical protein
MAANTPTRIDDDLFAPAKAVGAALSQRDIARVLAGDQSYDSLTAHEQAVVRADWDERMTALREGLDFTAELSERGLDWADVKTQVAAHHHDAKGALYGSDHTLVTACLRL